MRISIENKILSYDRYLIQYSGGKDSTACLLHLLELGIDPAKIELWHQDIDGRKEHFMDWPITPDYCRKFAAAFNIPIYYNWRDGGFEREMNRMYAPTAPVYSETPEGIKTTGGDGPKNTRLKFPQVSGDMQKRWCSGYLKIDVCSSAIRMQKRFNTGRTLVVTGERAEESTARAKLQVFEVHRADLRHGKVARYVDHYRPLKHWPEREVWEILERWNVRAHPAYWLGFSRCSCLHCIFGNRDQFKTSQFIDPKGFDKITTYERLFNYTMKQGAGLEKFIECGTVYVAAQMDKELIRVAMQEVYPYDIIMNAWELPPGAYGSSCGPS